MLDFFKIEELEEGQKQLEDRIESLERRYKRMIDVVGQLQVLVTKEGGDITAINGVISTLQTTIAALKEQIATLQANGVDPAVVQPLLDQLNAQEVQLNAIGNPPATA